GDKTLDNWQRRAVAPADKDHWHAVLLGDGVAADEHLGLASDEGGANLLAGYVVEERALLDHRVALRGLVGELDGEITGLLLKQHGQLVLGLEAVLEEAAACAVQFGLVVLGTVPDNDRAPLGTLPDDPLDGG